MEFLNLKIQNINSIAEAEIDFKNLLPKDEHVFLVWGPSGAGKTTVLDAISLALFKKVPRMENVVKKNEGKYFDDDFKLAGQKEMSTTDIRQFLKRGTKEGICKLEFLGNDDEKYTASLRLSINKNNNLNNVEWILQSKKGILDKIGDVEREIQNVTGLTYEQFCRTTLLAQGEFTKFIKSDQNDKAEILEKLTDTGIYSEIGRKIFEKHKTKKTEYDNLTTQNENIKRLTDEELKEFDIQKVTLENEIAALNTEVDSIKKKKDWIVTFDKLKQKLSENENNLNKSKNEIDSEDYVERDKKQKLWENTEPQRNIYKSIKEDESNLSILKNEQKDLLRDFNTFSAGINSLKKELEQIKEEGEELTKEKESLSKYEDVYDKSEIIIIKLKDFNKHKTNIESNKKQLNELSERISKNVGEIKKLEKANSLIVNDINSLDDELKPLKEGEQKTNYDELLQQKQIVSEQVTTLNHMTILAQQLETNSHNAKQQSELLEKDSKACAAKKEAFEKLKQDYDKAKNETQTAQKCYDSAANSVKDFAKQMRATLQIGDNCPVCGKKIDTLLSNEAVEASVRQIFDNLTICKNHEKELYDKTLNLDSEISSLNNRINIYRQNLNSLDAEKKQKLSDLSRHAENVGIVVNKTMKQNIAAKQSQLSEKNKILDKKIKEFQDLSNRIKNISSKIDAKRNEKSKNDTQKSELEKSGIKLNGDKEHLENQIDSDEKSLNNLKSEISETLNDLYLDFAEKPIKTAEKLTKDAENYSKLVKKHENIETQISEFEKIIQESTRYQNQIMSLFAWKSSENVNPCENLVENWEKLNVSCSNYSVKFNNIVNQLDKNKKNLEVYFEENPYVSKVRFEKIASLPYEEIDKIKKMNEQLRDNYKNAITLLNHAKQEFENHKNNRPEIAENETLDTLNENIRKKNAEIDTKREQIATINSKVSQDAENKKRYSEILQLLDNLKLELNKWEHLKSLFGDADGTKFRKIAQSYILQKLLDSTNYFLAQLSDRYQLTNQGRDLLILVKDKYLNNCSRPIDTVSGGESFIISIALALGLSQLSSQGFSSDFIFIDEGISQLDSGRCDNIVNTLQQLHHIINCNIGIVSHLDKLSEMIPTKINVVPVSNGTSKIIIKRTI